MTNATTVTPDIRTQVEGTEQGRVGGCESSTEGFRDNPGQPAPSMLAMYRAGWKVTQEMFRDKK